METYEGRDEERPRRYGDDGRRVGGDGGRDKVTQEKSTRKSVYDRQRELGVDCHFRNSGEHFYQ